jgi:type IV pilus assembly protein PilE
MRYRYSRGVTLIELMIVVVVVAILASISYPSYRQYAIRANRTEAKTALLQSVQSLEKCYTRYHAYNHASCQAATVLGSAQQTPGGHYSVVAAQLQAQSYLLTATPRGGQAEDTRCGILSIDETNRRRERNGQDPVAANKCW